VRPTVVDKAAGVERILRGQLPLLRRGRDEGRVRPDSGVLKRVRVENKVRQAQEFREMGS
jgi:hypothetical protein